MIHFFLMRNVSYPLSEIRKKFRTLTRKTQFCFVPLILSADEKCFVLYSYSQLCFMPSTNLGLMFHTGHFPHKYFMASTSWDKCFILSIFLKCFISSHILQHNACLTFDYLVRCATSHPSKQKDFRPKPVRTAPMFWLSGRLPHFRNSEQCLCF